MSYAILLDCRDWIISACYKLSCLSVYPVCLLSACWMAIIRLMHIAFRPLPSPTCWHALKAVIICCNQWQQETNTGPLLIACLVHPCFLSLLNLLAHHFLHLSFVHRPAQCVSNVQMSDFFPRSLAWRCTYLWNPPPPCSSCLSHLPASSINKLPHRTHMSYPGS